jgi:hypothetical protein
VVVEENLDPNTETAQTQKTAITSDGGKLPEWMTRAGFLESLVYEWRGSKVPLETARYRKPLASIYIFTRNIAPAVTFRHASSSPTVLGGSISQTTFCKNSYTNVNCANQREKNAIIFAALPEDSRRELSNHVYMRVLKNIRK